MYFTEKGKEASSAAGEVVRISTLWNGIIMQHVIPTKQSSSIELDPTTTPFYDHFGLVHAKQNVASRGS